MSLSSRKTDNINSNGDSGCNRPQVRIMDDSQWLFVRKSFRISPREMDVAKLVCSGFSNEEIASRLNIKITTVKTHLRNVYRRIRVQRKLDMLLMFLDHGSKYTNSASSSTMPVVKIKPGLMTEIDGSDRIAGS